MRAVSWSVVPSLYVLIAKDHRGERAAAGGPPPKGDTEGPLAPRTAPAE